MRVKTSLYNKRDATCWSVFVGSLVWLLPDGRCFVPIIFHTTYRTSFMFFNSQNTITQKTLIIFYVICVCCLSRWTSEPYYIRKTAVKARKGFNTYSPSLIWIGIWSHCELFRKLNAFMTLRFWRLSNSLCLIKVEYPGSNIASTHQREWIGKITYWYN